MIPRRMIEMGIKKVKFYVTIQVRSDNWPNTALLLRNQIPAGRTTQKFYRRMIFNILVRNTDDQPRNHGILFNGSKASLSLAYDIMPSFARADAGTAFRLTMCIGDQGRRGKRRLREVPPE